MLSCIQIVKYRFEYNPDTDNGPNPNPTTYKMLHSNHSANGYFAVLQKLNFVLRCFVAAKIQIYCKYQQMVCAGQWMIAWFRYGWYKIHWARENIPAAQNDEIRIRQVHCLYSTTTLKILTVDMKKQKQHNIKMTDCALCIVYHDKWTFKTAHTKQQKIIFIVQYFLIERNSHDLMCLSNGLWIDQMFNFDYHKFNLRKKKKPQILCTNCVYHNAI